MSSEEQSRVKTGICDVWVKSPTGAFCVPGTLWATPLGGHYHPARFTGAEMEAQDRRDLDAIKGNARSTSDLRLSFPRDR